ncbi:MAG: O-antigen ligase family protein [Acidobacteriota bacterium]
MTEPKRAAWSAAQLAIAVALTLAFPPDVYPESGAIASLLLAGALWCATARTRWGILLIGAAWLALQCASSLAPARTVTTVMRLVLPVAALAAAAGIGPVHRRWLLWAASVAGAALGLLAIAQKWLILPASAAWARESGAAREILVRLDSGRPFATHVVPAALAGALTLALAASVALAMSRHSRRAALALAVPITFGLILTASLGAFIALAASLALLLVPMWQALPRSVRWGTVIGVPLLLATLVALRPVPILDLSRADHPLRLRLGNWRAAVLIAPQAPFVGTGLGSYGALMPQVRRAGDQETLFAHNSWLQLCVEGGLPAAFLLLAAAVWLSRRWRWVGANENRVLLAGVTAFAVHNLFDFTAYLPGVAVAAGAFIGGRHASR